MALFVVRGEHDPIQLPKEIRTVIGGVQTHKLPCVAYGPCYLQEVLRLTVISIMQPQSGKMYNNS